MFVTSSALGLGKTPFLDAKLALLVTCHQIKRAFPSQPQTSDVPSSYVLWLTDNHIRNTGTESIHYVKHVPHAKNFHCCIKMVSMSGMLSLRKTFHAREIHWFHQFIIHQFSLLRP